jgi:hypothetical protein
MKTIIIMILLLVSTITFAQQPIIYQYNNVERTDINTSNKDYSKAIFNISIDPVTDILSIHSGTDIVKFRMQPQTYKTDIINNQQTVIFDMINIDTGNTNNVLIQGTDIYMLENNYLFKFDN